jgi:exopolyphosphatase / guanosine-5'-triphosphate,3'-diphosphate pyrophosphatase
MTSKRSLKIAAIDIGTNSVHMIIANAVGSGLEIVDREKDLVLLGQGVFETGAILEHNLNDAVEALRKNVKLAHRHGVHEILCTATSAVRESSNGGEFLSRLRHELGLDVRIISGDEEARLIFLAVREALDLAGKRTLVVDLGGGSVELVLSDPAQKPVALESLKLGSLRLGEHFVRTDPLSKKDRRALLDHIAETADPLLHRLHGMGIDQVVGTSGTILTLGNVVNVRGGGTPWSNPNGQRISTADLGLTVEALADMTIRERVKLPGLDQKRAKSIVAGGFLTHHILEVIGQKELILCDWALREGLVLDYLETHPDTLEARERFPDLRHRSVHELAHRIGCSDPHAEQVARLALSIFDQIGGLAGLGPAEREILEYAALLHDAGQYIGYALHDRHSAYIIKHSQLRGFSRDELLLLATVARYHRGKSPKKRHPEYGALGKRDRSIARALSAILGVADGLDRSHYQAVSRVECHISRELILIEVYPRLDAELELWAARRKSGVLSLAFDKAVELELANA